MQTYFRLSFLSAKKPEIRLRSQDNVNFAEVSTFHALFISGVCQKQQKLLIKAIQEAQDKGIYSNSYAKLSKKIREASSLAVFKRNIRKMDLTLLESSGCHSCVYVTASHLNSYVHSFRIL